MAVGYLALTYVLIFLVVFCALSLRKKTLVNNVGLKGCICLFPLVLGIVTAFFVPFRNTDLYYQFQQIEKLSGTAFSAFSKKIFENSMWGEDLIFWVFSRFGYVELYPLFFTTIIVGIALILGTKNYKKISSGANRCNYAFDLFRGQ